MRALVLALCLCACAAPGGPASLQIVPADYYSKQAPASVRAGPSRGPSRIEALPAQPRSDQPQLEEASERLRDLQRQLNKPEAP